MMKLLGRSHIVPPKHPDKCHLLWSVDQSCRVTLAFIPALLIVPISFLVTLALSHLGAGLHPPNLVFISSLQATFAETEVSFLFCFVLLLCMCFMLGDRVSVTL